jgi:hypothetical protein
MNAKAFSIQSNCRAFKFSLNDFPKVVKPSLEELGIERDKWAAKGKSGDQLTQPSRFRVGASMVDRFPILPGAALDLHSSFCLGFPHTKTK